jgi:hypothetical protein
MEYKARFTRRGILMLSCASAARLYGREADFWNKKEPSEWSRDEIDRLTSKSPWAKEVTASAGPNGRGGGGGMGGGGRRGGMGGGMGIPGIGGIGMPGGGMGGGGMGRDRDGGWGGGGRSPQFQGVIRWESAQPILDALKSPLPKDFDGRYVISVSGFPILSRRREGDDTDATVSRGASEDVLERVKAMTYLEPKGKAPAQPGLVQEAPGGTGRTATVLFGFSKETLQFTAADREVTFTTQLGNLQVKAKFDLKEMMYHKQLAL